jgi:hypothetical protein
VGVIEPQKDMRDRVSESVLLYVVRSNLHHADGRPLYLEILDSCERSVLYLKEHEGKYVRYKNHAYKLYSRKSFKKLLNRARQGDLALKHYEGISSRRPELLKRIPPAHYCVLESSPGHFFRF